MADQENRAPRHELTPHQRGQILGRIESGCSQRRVAQEVGCSRGAVRRTIAMLQERVNGQAMSCHGRPRKTNKDDDEALYHQRRAAPAMSLHTLHAILASSIHFDTMRRRLRKAHLQMWQRVKRPALSPEQAAARLAWALLYRHWTVEDWGRILWSDECFVEKSAGNSQQWVYCTQQDKWKPDLVQPTHRAGRISVMVWAAFSAYGRSLLVICEGDPNAPRGGVTGRTYLRLLQQQLPSLMRPDMVFMHDNAPIHISHNVRDWLQAMGYHVMSWPPYFPDLNPIEHCWFPLKRNIHRVAPELCTMTNKAACQQLLRTILPGRWNAIPRMHFTKLIESMPCWVQAVIEAEGWYTHY